jgi:hypothetical protein
MDISREVIGNEAIPQQGDPMKSSAELFCVVVWHRDAVYGVHQSMLLKAATAAQALTSFSKYVRKVPPQMRSFGPRHQVQLYGPDGKIADIPHIAQ